MDSEKIERRSSERGTSNKENYKEDQRTTIHICGECLQERRAKEPNGNREDRR